MYKVESFYQFWNTTANAEKQLLEWLGEGSLEDKEGYEVLNQVSYFLIYLYSLYFVSLLHINQNTFLFFFFFLFFQNVMKQERRDNRLDSNVLQISEHQNNIEINIMDNMSIIQMPDGSEQFTTVPMDASGTIQIVRTSTEVSHDQNQVAHIEEVGSEIEENSDDGCDNEESKYLSILVNKI